MWIYDKKVGFRRVPGSLDFGGRVYDISMLDCEVNKIFIVEDLFFPRMGHYEFHILYYRQSSKLGNHLVFRDLRLLAYASAFYEKYSKESPLDLYQRVESGHI